MADDSHLVCPSIERLMEEARTRTGLDDFGNPARNAGLQAYLESLRDETWDGLTPHARALAFDYLAHLLATRLRLIADRKAYPQISAQAIVAPLIVVGPPRSGSTLLHTLLSLDPASMAPEHWMCREPSPPLVAGPPTATRLEAADRRMSDLFGLIPDIFVTHPYMIEAGSGALAECGSDVLSMVCTSQQMWCFWGGDQYRRYLLEADHREALAFHHDFLQHLQCGNTGKRWALKGSDHMLWLSELAAQYPDARLIWTHRDLSQQLASLASVQSILKGLNGNPVTPEIRYAQGRRAIDLQRASIEKAIQARDAIGEERFIDISYHQMMHDPLATIRRIYEWAGLEMTDVHAAAITGWLSDHHQTRHGAHKHSPEEFGMSAADVNREFAPYVERFGFGFDIRPALVA